MAGGRSHIISCVFGDIVPMATKNVDVKRSRAVLEKHDVVLHLNFV